MPLKATKTTTPSSMKAMKSKGISKIAKGRFAKAVVLKGSKVARARIGIILIHPEHERKGQLFECSDLEWTKSVPKKWIFERKFGQKYGFYGIPTDVATGAYIQYALKPKDLDIDLILPAEVSKERLRSNDLNFVLKYGMVESYRADRSSGKEHYNIIKECLLGEKNMYPPRDIQEFLINKSNYYNYFNEKKVSILPTFTMTAKEYHELGHDAAMKKVLEWRQRANLGTVIGKPDLGCEAIGFESFKATDRGRRHLSRYFRKTMNKYPGLVIQKEVKGFGDTKECPELRMYFVGDKYKYSVSSNVNAVVSHPKAEGGTLTVPLSKLTAVTQKIMKKLPPIVINGVRLPRLTTRLDMGWRVDGKYQAFLNEVEFYPSVYAEYRPIREKMMDWISSSAKQIVKISRQYIKGRRALGSRSRGSRHVLKPHFLKRNQSAAKS